MLFFIKLLIFILVIILKNFRKKVNLYKRDMLKEIFESIWGPTESKKDRIKDMIETYSESIRSCKNNIKYIEEDLDKYIELLKNSPNNDEYKKELGELLKEKKKFEEYIKKAEARLKYYNSL